MRGKIAFLLIIAILCCGMNVFADESGEQVSSTSANEIPEESSALPVETDQADGTEKETETEKVPDKTDRLDMEDEDSGGQEEQQAELSDEKIISDSDENVLYQVSFPANTKAYFDPGNLSGRGQVFSDRFTVENYGNTNVAIKIKHINVYYLSADDIYEFSDHEITDSASHVKKMNINMVWENEDMQTEKVLQISEGARDEMVLWLRAAKYSESGEFLSLSDGGTGSFYFTGTVNANPNLNWEDGEITVSFDYEIVNVEEEEPSSVSSGNLS